MDRRDFIRRGVAGGAALSLDLQIKVALGRIPGGFPIGQCATPTFSPGAGSYSSAQTVTISCVTPSSTIYYTTDGTTPTTSSTVYSSPIPVSATATLKAIATAPGFVRQSAVGSASYSIGSGALVGYYKFNPGRSVSSEADENTTPFSQWQTEVNTWWANPTGFVGVRYTLCWRDLEDFTQPKNLNNPAAITTQYPGVLLHQAAFYYEMAVSAGTAQYSLFVNFDIISPGTYTNSVITGTNWLTSGSKSVPRWIINCTGISGTSTPGTLTVPDSYGAATTSLYSGPVAPMYSGSPYYGISFCGFDGTTAFSRLTPKFWEPPVNQARKQALQALAQFQFTAGSAWSSATAYTVGTPVTSGGQNWLCVANNTNSLPAGGNANWMINSWVGQTIDTAKNCERWGTNDEYAYSFISGAGNNISGCAYQNPPFSNGISSIAPTSANAFVGLTALTEAWEATTQNTVVDTCPSFGFDGSGTLDSNSNMPGYWNDNISGAGLSAIQGVALGNSNWFANVYSASANTAIANPFQQGHLGISPALGPSAFTLPTGTFPSLVTEAPLSIQHQPEDFWQGLPSGTAGSSAAAVTACIAPGTKVSATHEYWNITTSQPGSPFQFLPTFYTSVTQPTLASVPLASVLMQRSLMRGAQNLVVEWTSTTTATATWLGDTNAANTSHGWTITVNGTPQSGSPTTASASSMNLTGLTPGATVTVGVAMSNANGAGPAATFPLTMPTFDYPSGFAGSSGQINVAGNGGLVGSTIQIINTSQSHAAGGVWYKTLVSFANGFTSNFSFQMTNAMTSGPGLTFVLQNDPRGNSITGDANGCGYAAFEQFSGNIPITNSIGIKFDLGGMGFYTSPPSTNPPTGFPNSVGLYMMGGFADALLPMQDLNPYGINIHVGDIIECKVVYDLNILTLTILDATTGAQARYSWPVTISTFTGASTAFVGFGAGTVGGPSNADVNLLTWDYTPGIAPRLATPTFSVTPGQYASTQTVALSGPAEASIYYTTNCQEPSNTSTLYTTPITVSANTIVKAVAIQSGFTDSFVATGNYLIQASGQPTINMGSGLNANLVNVVGRAAFSGSAIKLTDGTNPPSNGELGGFWYGAPVTVSGSWTTSFQFNLNAGSARGICFVLQNQPSASASSSLFGVTGGPFALGHGSGFGYAGSGITNSGGGLVPAQAFGLATSVAVYFGTFGSGSSFTGVYTDGTVLPSSSNATAVTGPSLTSGHSMNVVLTYSGTTLTVSITDSVTSANFTHNFTVDIPTTVGASIANVGVTGTDFGGAAQQVNSWKGF